MTNYPTQLDEIDQWLADNFNIIPGACSSTENLRYNTAKMIAEALWPKCKDSLPKDFEEAAGKPILDACCGGKMFYFDKNDPRVLFQDIRSFKDKDIYKGRTFSVEPDVVADFTSMPYPDESFNMVVFDPPHLKYTSEKETKGWQMEKYGWLPRGCWRETIEKGFSECFRVLRPGGFLIFKWNETDIKVSEVLALTDQKPVFGHISGKRANTHWICFMKTRGKSFTDDIYCERDQVEGPSRDQVDMLKEAAEEYAKDETMSGLAERAFKAGANWQKEQDKETIELAEDHAMLAGMVKQEEEMKEKALEVTVYPDDDGYPCIPEIVLFDFDKNQPTAKEGDKVKVYIFKN